MHANIMREIGWHVAGTKGSQIFFRTLGPLTIAKVQRPKHLDLTWLASFRKTHHTLTTYIEPGLATIIPPKTRVGFKVEPFAHSCTSLIDISRSEQEILNSFSQKTRYNIIHTLKKDDIKITSTKLGQLTESQRSDFFLLHEKWSKKKKVIGYPISLLNAVFKAHSETADLHLCYQGDTLVASLLVMYFDGVATYYAAFATNLGYKTFAPTLLTWTAIKKAIENNCNIFDFGGIYDPRYPKMYKNWQGFTKFKSGFNPTVVSYPPTTLQLFW